MFKGIGALFTTGAIFNPMVLLGIILGTFFFFGLTTEQAFELYFDIRFYALAFIIALLYNFIFKKTYDDDGFDLDYKEMGIHTVGSFLLLIFSSLMMISFINLMYFGGGDDDLAQADAFEAGLKQ